MRKSPPLFISKALYFIHINEPSKLAGLVYTSSDQRVRLASQASALYKRRGTTQYFSQAFPLAPPTHTKYEERGSPTRDGEDLPYPPTFTGPETRDPIRPQIRFSPLCREFHQGAIQAHQPLQVYREVQHPTAQRVSFAPRV